MSADRRRAAGISAPAHLLRLRNLIEDDSFASYARHHADISPTPPPQRRIIIEMRFAWA